MKDLLLLVPRLARMLASLLADREVPRGAKVALVAAALYLASPVDLLPDFLPVVGYLDDLLLAAVVVDGVLTLLGRPLVQRYWPGDPASFQKVAAVAHRLAAWVPRRLRRRVFGPF